MKDCGQIFDELERRALMLGVQLTDAQRQQILSFAGLLAAYNEHTNLVSRADLATLVLEHALDSLSLIAPIKVILQEKECSQPFPLADIGSGGGFPAMIVAIMMPMAEITMFEAVGKKCRFLVEAAHELGLSSRARVKNGRVEELAHRKEYRSHFLLATARAVGAVDVIAELCVPLLQKGGLLLAQKSKGQVDEELAHGRSLIGRLNARVERVVNLPAEALGKERLLVLIEKIGDTPPQYPRAWSAIKRGQKPR